MKVVLTLSGGMDSAVLLYYLKYRMESEVLCLSVDYGQRHARELTCAKELCRVNCVEHKIADLQAVKELMAGSSQTSDVPVPEGHFAEECMKATIVPNRNMLLLALAGAWAISRKADAVAYAAHAGDHTIYPDCRPDFADAMAEALELCDWHPVRLIRPFLGMDKLDLVRLGTELGIPFELTWSCYKGLDKHCGRCGTCVERREAFGLAGISDPVPYEV